MGACHFKILGQHRTAVLFDTHELNIDRM